MIKNIVRTGIYKKRVNKTPMNITESITIITNDKLLAPARQKKKIGHYK